LAVILQKGEGKRKERRKERRRERKAQREVMSFPQFTFLAWSGIISITPVSNLPGCTLE